MLHTLVIDLYIRITNQYSIYLFGPSDAEWNIMRKNISFWRSASNIFCNFHLLLNFRILPIKCTPFKLYGLHCFDSQKSRSLTFGFPSGTLICYVRVFIVWTPDHQVCAVISSLCFVNYDIVLDNIFVVGDVFLVLILVWCFRVLCKRCWASDMNDASWEFSQHYLLHALFVGHRHITRIHHLPLRWGNRLL